jgi:hypothetical protein
LDLIDRRAAAVAGDRRLARTGPGQTPAKEVRRQALGRDRWQVAVDADHGDRGRVDDGQAAGLGQGHPISLQAENDKAALRAALSVHASPQAAA